MQLPKKVSENDHGSKRDFKVDKTYCPIVCLNTERLFWDSQHWKGTIRHKEVRTKLMAHHGIAEAK